jgi:hypothetical protein
MSQKALLGFDYYWNETLMTTFSGPKCRGGDVGCNLPCAAACGTNLKHDMQNATSSPDDECLLQQR